LVSNSKIHFEKETPKKLHIDLCGSMKTTSVGGAKYFMTFMDDNTIMLWIYFLKQKLEVSVVFKEFQTMVEISSK
jgi:hypothetical protein